MALDPRHGVAGEPERPAGDAPRMLRRPSDALPPLGNLGDTDAVRTLRSEWSSRAERAAPTAAPRTRLRAWAGRVSGRSDRRLLAALSGATLEVVERCDVLAGRLASHEALTEDLSATLGEELTRLRAEVRHLAKLVATLDDDAHG